MKKNIIVILLGLLSSSVFSQFDNKINWQSTSIKIDGNANDWASQPRYYEDKTKLAFDIRNDSSNLYLVFKASDEKTQFKIARAGMSIDFATKIKPKRKAAIVFSPFINEKPGTGMHDKNNNISKKREQSIVKLKYLLSPALVQASGFAHTYGTLSLKDNNINYAVAWDSLNIMIIEFKIPLSELFGDKYDLKKIAQKDICLKLKENAIENPGSLGGGYSHEGHGGGEGGMGHGGGGSYHHGGGETGESGEHQYGSGGGMQDRTSMFEAQTLKQKFKLNGNTK